VARFVGRLKARIRQHARKGGERAMNRNTIIVVVVVIVIAVIWYLYVNGNLSGII
jgi:hypothetical protein